MPLIGSKLPKDKHIIDEDPKKFGKKIKPVVDSLGQNNGEFIPTALQMIENLKTTKPGQNPKMVDSVGAGALASALKAVSKIFANNAANTDPCSIPRDQQTEQQIGECACKVPEAQRTPQQAADCLFWTTLQDSLTANTANT